VAIISREMVSVKDSKKVRELWKPVVGYEQYYEVSNLGKVRRIGSQHILRPRMSNGYCLVDLRTKPTRKYCRVHRLVAIAFIGEPPTDKHEVCHIDGDKENNIVDNLRWGTRADNERDKILHDRTNRGQRNGQAKLTPEQVAEIRLLLSKGDMLQRQIGDLFGITRQTVSDIKGGRSWAK